ncbi:MAG TPA: tRNA (N(6)-L-threonylcarbamoyladenosine(37)-C(2))-methylthiotransferase MtaB [Terriglobales bacterium]
MPNFYIENFGCRATQADGAAIERQLEQRGFTPAEDSAHADVVVLNTCTVTASADQDARAAVRRIQRENSGCKILVTGCYAQRAPEEVAALPGVSWVVGNSHKMQVADVITGAFRSSNSAFVSLDSLRQPQPDSGSLLVGDIFAHTELLAAPVFELGASAHKTRPNLKIQDGCDNRCSFCIIPFVRGQSRSLPAEEVLREVEALQQAGYREIVLSGINLGRWGRDFAQQERFAGLLHVVLQRTSIEKIRISSVEPMDWNDDLIALMASSPRIAHHAHLPLQSGSDRILRLMHRKYRPWHYAEKVQRIRELVPDAAIGADVMTGFPCEDEAAFEESRKFIEHLPFTYLHVFTYSPRPGTPSATMPSQVPVQVARERTRILRDLSASKNREFRARFAGSRLQAITLTQQDGSSTEALTDNYLKLRIAGRHPANQWMNVHIDGLSGDGLLGSCQQISSLSA